MKLSELLNVLKTAETAEEMDVRREEIAALIPAVRTMFGYVRRTLHISMTYGCIPSMWS